MMELKTINILQKDYKSDEDFFLSVQAFIGPEQKPYEYEVYRFYVISLKRLCEEFMEEGVMLNRGWMITKYYSESMIEEKIKELIQICASQNDDDTFLKLNSYLRMEDHE